MKKPASEMHFTLVVAGRRALNLSQCNIEANPPAEQPERIAYNKQIPTSCQQVVKRLMNELPNIKQGLTFLAFLIPFAKRSSMIASQILFPLK